MKKLISIVLVLGLFLPVLTVSQSDKELKSLQTWLKELKYSKTYSIEEFKNLQTLRLNDNQLTSLPKEIGQLKNLKDLSLWNNELTSLPKEISQLKNLKELYLQGNPISENEVEKIKNLLPDCEVQH